MKDEPRETIRQLLHDHYARNARRAAAVIRGTEKARTRAATAARARWNKKESSDDTRGDDYGRSDQHIQSDQHETRQREESLEVRADELGNGVDTRRAEDLDAARKRILDELFFGG